VQFFGILEGDPKRIAADADDASGLCAVVGKGIRDFGAFGRLEETR